MLIVGIVHATTYGKPIYKKCSQCSGAILVPNLTSGNTFGAKYWTDGKREARMLPDSFWLVKCPHCNVLLWIDEQEKTKRKPNAKYYIEPSLEDYYKILQKDTLSEEKERYLRIRAWWKSNDKRRRSQNHLPLSLEEKDNLKALFELLSTTKNYFMKAEIKRELGEFDKAKKILDELNTENSNKKVKLLMRKLIDEKNIAVQEIEFNK